MDRRRFLKLSGVTGYLSLAVFFWYKVAYNIYLGYGKNVKTQNVSKKVRSDLSPSSHESQIGGYGVETTYGSITVSKDGRKVDVLDASTETVDEHSDTIDTQKPSLNLLPIHLDRLESGDFTVKPMSMEDFFDYTRENHTNPYLVGVVRGKNYLEKREEVTDFTDTNPSNPEKFLNSLSDNFKRKTSYDVPRYIAGSITYHVLMGEYDVRDLLEHEVDYEALNENQNTRMFCNEYTDRAIEGLYSTPPDSQPPPVFAGDVWDKRHKHSYNAVASIVTDGRDIEIPVTFVDYTYTTLYDDFGIDELFGKDIDAYNNHHRITAIDWV